LDFDVIIICAEGLKHFKIKEKLAYALYDEKIFGDTGLNRKLFKEIIFSDKLNIKEDLKI